MPIKPKTISIGFFSKEYYYQIAIQPKHLDERRRVYAYAVPTEFNQTETSDAVLDRIRRSVTTKIEYEDRCGNRTKL